MSYIVLMFNIFTALIAIGRYSMTIETVDVGWCKEITDHGATQIAQSSKSLRYLGLMRCDQVRSICVNCCLLLSMCECECSCVYLSVRDTGGFMFFCRNRFGIQYCGNSFSVLCSHI